jgi:hypothetical protein
MLVLAIEVRLPDIGRPTAATCLRIADPPSTAAADEIVRRYVGQCDAWQLGRNAGCRHLPNRWFLKGTSGMAICPSRSGENHYHTTKRMRHIEPTIYRTLTSQSPIAPQKVRLHPRPDTDLTAPEKCADNSDGLTCLSRPAVCLSNFE